MHWLLKRFYHGLLNRLTPRTAVSLSYFVGHGTFPGLENPRTFTEKIQYRKLFDRDERLPKLADKVLVKAYVEARLGPAWIVPTLWHGRRLPRLAERNWPLPFFIKANNGSGTNYLVRHESDKDWQRIEAICENWMAAPNRAPLGEWAYTQIVPQLLIEPFIGIDGSLPWDYKLMVFNGRVEFIQVDTGRGTVHRRTFFDREWRRQPYGLKYPVDPRDVPIPVSLKAMIEGAEALATDFSFVRVDMYEIDSRPLFGEMTFYPDSGTGRFRPRLYDEKWGRLLIRPGPGEDPFQSSGNWR
jgi:TupA-like ATPgrasp